MDKVYIESYRSGVIADDALLETVKAFFKAHGVEVAGGIAFAAEGHGWLGLEAGSSSRSPTPTPKQRAYVKHVSEVTARHFDEIMLDDFFFNNTKRDSDIAAKGNESWTGFRLKLMDEVSRDLVVGPARAVNPKVKIIIKFPNWYEHFQANGYDLDQEPKIFDGIYTGTETRDPVITDQHLQQYESYQIIRYFDNIAPGRNGGGWVDTFDTRYVDRYAEQLWDTMLAKAPQIMLFQWSDLLQPAEPRRPSGSGAASKPPSTTKPWNNGTRNPAHPRRSTMRPHRRLLALNRSNAVVGKLGKPIGIASYKPYQSSGEDFLHNYLGMIGIPIDLHPEFPADARHGSAHRVGQIRSANCGQDQGTSGQGRQRRHHLRPAEGARGQGPDKSSRSPRSTPPAMCSASISTGAHSERAAAPTWARPRTCWSRRLPS